jgi:hypothetical protein
MRRMAILRRLLTAFWLVLAWCSFSWAQSVTTIDGSQTNIVIVGSGNSSSGWIAWRSKFIPEHVIFAFELPANFTAVNPVVECTLDDQQQGLNPNDLSRWRQIGISVPLNPASNPAFDVAGPSVGTVAQPAGVVIVETGVFPCTAWAIQPGGSGLTFTANGTSKVTAVQLPSSGDASFLNAVSNTTLSSGSNRIIPTANNGTVGTPQGPLPVNILATPTIADFTLANYAGFSNGNTNFLAETPFFVCNPSHQACKLRLCQNPAQITALGASTVQVIGVTAGAQNRVCDVVMSNTNATATTVSLVTGTGVNCASVTATLLAPVTLSANTGSSPTFVLHLGAESILTHPAVVSEEVCAVGSAAGSVNVSLVFEAD